MKTLICIVVFMLQCSFAFGQAGYKRTPWGSNVWEGPGPPPHWSTSKSDSRSEKKKYTKKRNHFHNNKKGIYHKPRYIYRQYRNVYIPLEKQVPYPRTQTRTIVKTRYVPVPAKSSRNICGGDTQYFKDKNTGEIIIKYVTAAKKC